MVCIYIYDIKVDLRHNQQKNGGVASIKTLPQAAVKHRSKTRRGFVNGDQSFFAYLRISIYIATNSHLGQHDVAEDI